MSWFDDNPPVENAWDAGQPEGVSGAYRRGPSSYDPAAWDTPQSWSIPAQEAPSGPTLVGLGSPQAYFQSLIQGRPGTPETLISLEPQLAQAGIQVLRNAAGVAGKIRLPDGSIVDVIRSAMSGGGGPENWQWLTGDGGAGSPYQMGTFTGGGRYPLASVTGPGFMQPWTTPFSFTGAELPTDPAFKFRLGEGQKAIERSAAAKGTLLTGGTLKDLQGFAQGLASTEYDNAWRRAMEEYQQAYGIYTGNRANQINYLGGLSSGGQSAAAGLGNAGENYAAGASTTLGNIGSAYGAGAMGQGNIWGNFWNNAGQIGSQLPWYIDRGRQGAQGTSPYTGAGYTTGPYGYAEYPSPRQPQY